MILPLVAGGLFVVLGAHLDIIGSSLLGTAMIALGVSIPMAAAAVRTYNINAGV